MTRWLNFASTSALTQVGYGQSTLRRFAVACLEGFGSRGIVPAGGIPIWRWNIDRDPLDCADFPVVVGAFSPPSVDFAPLGVAARKDIYAVQERVDGGLRLAVK